MQIMIVKIGLVLLTGAGLGFGADRLANTEMFSNDGDDYYKHLDVDSDYGHMGGEYWGNDDFLEHMLENLTVEEQVLVQEKIDQLLVQYSITLEELNNDYSANVAKKAISPLGNKALDCLVLLVEDNAVNQEVAKIMLEILGCQVIIAENGLQAVNLYSEHAFNIVYMDCHMPIMNGFEATKQIKEFRPSLPIIAQSAYSSAEDIERAKDAGCDDFLSKPINVESIKLILDKYLVKDLKS